MNYHDITCPDMNNGDGLRVVLWLSGCDHYCSYCQNPQTWDEESGVPFDKKAKNELFNDLSEDYISGITLTGGDPLYRNNLRSVYELVKEINISLPEKTIWLYTGYTMEDIFAPNYSKYIEDDLSECIVKVKEDIDKLYRREILRYVDVLIDGEYVDSERDITLKWRGSRNQRVINVQESIKQGSVVLWCD